ncbi:MULTISPECIES: hypothetical protein [Streptomyces]|uniref:hypothetical protein n=1 Tax=Streptomyces TaxID=1883 RepID=UPI001964D91B|nr:MULTISPECIES: hypothetical protein [Streptomyces]QRX90731.1 hypothetical protein JNO44_07730 [Streptomyces noursei]UJB40652.1 hypothetical protein HRD51_07290 [Streptomyces sp. A1-5]
MSVPSSVTVAGHGRTAFVPRPPVDPSLPPGTEVAPAPPRINAEVVRQTPVYAGLVKIWTERCATVPGVADPEWQRLVSYRALMEETELALTALRPHRAPDVLPPRRTLPVPPARYATELTPVHGGLRPLAHP